MGGLLGRRAGRRRPCRIGARAWRTAGVEKREQFEVQFLDSEVLIARQRAMSKRADGLRTAGTCSDSDGPSSYHRISEAEWRSYGRKGRSISKVGGSLNFEGRTQGNGQRGHDRRCIGYFDRSG